jgi:hypothetical protein
MFLEGTFSEYPFFWLLEILLHKKETGLLEIASPQQSGYFYIKDGEIKDAEVGKMRGPAAVKLASTFENASFKFKQFDTIDYAEIVWQKSFGVNHLKGDASFIPSEPLRTSVRQFFNYWDQVSALVEKAILWLRLQALPQVLRRSRGLYQNLEKTGVALAEGTLASFKTVHAQFEKWQRRVRPVMAVQHALTEYRIALRRRMILRHYNQIVLRERHSLNFQEVRSLTHQSAAVLSFTQYFPLLNEAKRRLLFNASVADQTFQDVGDLIARRVSGYASATLEFSTSLQKNGNLFRGWRIGLKALKVILQDKGKIILNKLKSQTTLLTASKAATLPPLQRAPQSNISSEVFEEIQVILYSTRQDLLEKLNSRRGRFREKAAPLSSLGQLASFKISNGLKDLQVIRRCARIILTRLNSQTRRIREKAMLLSFQKVAESNIAFGLFIFVLLAISVFCTIKFWPNTQAPVETFVTTENKNNAQPEPKRRQRASKPPAKRRR